jgi:peptide/nickel transport system ATP-binding protein
MSMADIVLSARDLTVEYALGKQYVRAVNGVSLELRAGETTALVGESGCGKTTLGRAILGLLPDDAKIGGSVRYGAQGGERDIYALPKDQRRRLRGKELSLVFQDPMTRLDPLLTVEQHFRELLRSHDAYESRGDARLRAQHALKEVGVPEARLDQYPHEFSGGMRQRIMIALALVLGPKVLVADEPTTSLDVIVEAQVLDLLRKLSKERGLATLLITHNLGIVAEVADRVLVMYAGDAVEEADVASLFARPQHPYTQGLLASTIHLGTQRLASIAGAPPDLSDPPPACRFHPRCPRAREICATRRPPRVEGALCWFPGVEERPVAPPAEWGARLRPRVEDVAWPRAAIAGRPGPSRAISTMY